MIIYAMLPTVLATCMEPLSVISVSYGGNEGTRYYLAADLTIATDSDKYDFVYAYGLTMGMVIAIVLPLTVSNGSRDL